MKVILEKKNLIKNIEDTNKWRDVCTVEELILLKYPYCSNDILH